MNKRTLILLAVIISGTAVIVSCNETPGRPNNMNPVADSAAQVKRGEYLVSIVGCDDCHSPKRMGANGPELIPELRLSGFPHDGKLPPVNKAEIRKGFAMFAPDLTAAVGPWGVSFAGNITSDATGIGNWPEENFIRAIRHGKLKGIESARPILPPMPWNVYKNMTDQDLKAVFAYLKTVKPVENVVPGPVSLADLK